MKVIGMKGLGVVWETDFDDRCDENGYCDWKIIWVTNFKLDNGKVIFRRKTENFYGEDGGEDCREELDYFYVNGNVLDSKFKLPYIEVDDNNETIKVSSEEIDVVEEIWEKVEWNDEYVFENDCGFPQIDETELDEILNSI